MSNVTTIDPSDITPDAVLDRLEGGDEAIHLTLQDDKEWWLAHDSAGEYPAEFDGPWLLWTTYPSGPWDLTACWDGLLTHHIEELRVPEPDGSEHNLVSEARAVPMDDAPGFVQGELADAEDGTAFHNRDYSQSFAIELEWREWTHLYALVAERTREKRESGEWPDDALERDRALRETLSKRIDVAKPGNGAEDWPQSMKEAYDETVLEMLDEEIGGAPP